MLLNKIVERILDVLLDHPNIGYSKKDLAEAADISRSALYNVWDILEEKEIVIPKKKYGGTTLYRLNPDSDLVDSLGRIMDAEEGEEEIKRASKSTEEAVMA